MCRLKAFGAAIRESIVLNWSLGGKVGGSIGVPGFEAAVGLSVGL